MKLPRSVRAPRGGLLGPLLAFVALVLPFAHELHEALGAPEVRGRAETVVHAACPPDCDTSGHRHHGHDPATCPACALLHGSSALAVVVRLAPPVELRGVRAAEVAIRASVAESGSGRPRGPPPATSSLA